MCNSLNMGRLYIDCFIQQDFLEFYKIISEAYFHADISLSEDIATYIRPLYDICGKINIINLQKNRMEEDKNEDENAVYKAIATSYQKEKEQLMLLIYDETRKKQFRPLYQKYLRLDRIM